MLRKSSKFLIFAVVIAAIALFAVTKARAVTCEVDGEDFPLSANASGEYFCPPGLEQLGCCDNIEDTSTNPASVWVVEVGTVEFPNRTEPECFDKKGNEIPSTGFAYLLHKPIGVDVSLAQFNVSMPASCPSEDINKVCPHEQSVKIVPYETVTGWPFNETLKIASWNSIKFDPSNKGTAFIGTTDATAAIGGIELITGNGPLYGAILTPDCCSSSHIETSRSFFTLTGAEPTIVKYDICTGEPSSGGPTTGGYLIVEAAYICPDVLEFDSKVCTEIKKIATRAGGLINVCIEGTNYAYFGHGNSIYRAATGICESPTAATIPTFEGPCEQEVVFDGKFVVRYPSCGFDPDDPPPPPPNEEEEPYDLTPQGCVIGPFTDCDNFGDFKPFKDLQDLNMTMCSTDDTQGKITYDCGLITDGGSGLGVPISNKWYFISGRWVWR
jgi:hypothetical protein